MNTVSDLDERRKISSTGSGGGDLVDHRLKELERRANNLESVTSEINGSVIEAKTTLSALKESVNKLPTKSDVENSISNVRIWILGAIGTVFAIMLGVLKIWP